MLRNIAILVMILSCSSLQAQAQDGMSPLRFSVWQRPVEFDRIVNVGVSDRFFRAGTADRSCGPRECNYHHRADDGASYSFSIIRTDMPATEVVEGFLEYFSRTTIPTLDEQFFGRRAVMNIFYLAETDKLTVSSVTDVGPMSILSIIVTYPSIETMHAEQYNDFGSFASSIMVETDELARTSTLYVDTSDVALETGRGVVRVAVLGETLSGSEIRSVVFGPRKAPSLDTTPDLTDVNGDGMIDSLFRFDLANTGLSRRKPKGCIIVEMDSLVLLGCGDVKTAAK